MDAMNPQFNPAFMNPGFAYYGPQYGYAGGMPPQQFPFQPYMAQNYQMPQNPQNALTKEEIEVLRNTRPSGKIDLSITEADLLRAMCTHKDINGNDVAMETKDEVTGYRKMFCPICQRSWYDQSLTEEEVKDIVDKFVNQIQIMKWVGDMPSNVIREYCAIMPLIEKFPELHKYAISRYNKLLNSTQFYGADGTGIFNMYNSLNTPNYAYMGGFRPQPGYYGQGMPMPPQQPMNGGYAPQMQPMPTVNPMQIQNPPLGGIQYQQPPIQYAPGFNPIPNQGNVNPLLANQMMGQPLTPTVINGQFQYQQPGQQFAPNPIMQQQAQPAPVAEPQQAQQFAPVYAPAQAAPQENPVTAPVAEPKPTAKKGK